MADYLVEVTSGREVIYHTAWALRAAMRSGEITSNARIYHRAGSRWISIVEHPEYRKFLAERRPPAWLEPIPFEPAERGPEPDPAIGRGMPDLAAGFRRGRSAVSSYIAARIASLREWMRREPEAKPPAPRNPAPAARGGGNVPASRPPGSPPQDPTSGPAAEPTRKGWTFYP